jgi:hypothetical protein
VATWTDRQCTNRSREDNVGILKITEQEVRRLYEDAGVTVSGIWVGDPDGQGIPSHFKDSWQSHRPEDFPYGSMDMLDGTHHMARLWQECFVLVPQEYEVIIHARPDQHFPPNYLMYFERDADHSTMVARIVRGDKNSTWTARLDAGMVFMSLNRYHMIGTDSGTIPDDRLGFGLAAPMRGVFETMTSHADEGDYDISDVQYRERWGPPEAELLDMPNTLLNPLQAWVRERYPEKLLKHHILRQGFNYTLIQGRYVSPYDVVDLEKEC